MMDVKVFKVSIHIFYESKTCTITKTHEYNVIAEDDLIARNKAIEFLKSEFLEDGKELDALKIKYCEINLFSHLTMENEVENIS